MGLLKSIFTWWNNATLGAWFTIFQRARKVGEDDFGNRYFEERRESLEGRRRRYVVYKGYADASRVPADWHGWLHHTFSEPPTLSPLKRQRWEKDHKPNLTGTLHAYRPAGSLDRGGERKPATGDYEAWSPEDKSG